MMKIPISWHEECLENRERGLHDAEVGLMMQTKRVERLREDYEFSIKQLKEAKKKGLDGFDNDRFMKKHK